MGLGSCILTLVVQAIIICLLIVFIPGLPPDGVEFSAYSVAPISPLNGPLGLNNKLSNVEKLFEGEIKGPEGLAVYKDELYTGIRGGHLIKIRNGKIVPVLKFGKECDDLWEEPKCGRIMGINIDKNGMLYAVDGYYGIFKVNLTSGDAETIAAKDDLIDGKPLKLANAIEADSTEYVYWTISSTSHELHNSVYSFFDSGNGRLIKTHLKTKAHEVLLDNLHFPNGVALAEDESFILVSETARARILRYYLKGPKKGTFDIFVDRLPGLPDNLRRTSNGDFLIPLVESVEEDAFHLPFALAPYPLLRKFIVRAVSLIELSIETFNSFYPMKACEQVLYFIGNFDSTRILIGSKRATIIRTNSEGQIIESYHTTDGRMPGISDVLYFHGAYYLSSPFSSFLARVKISS